MNRPHIGLLRSIWPADPVAADVVDLAVQVTHRVVSLTNELIQLVVGRPLQFLQITVLRAAKRQWST